MGFQSFQPKVESRKPLLLGVGEFEDRSFRIAFTARDRASSFGHLKQIRRAFSPPILAQIVITLPTWMLLQLFALLRLFLRVCCKKTSLPVQGFMQRYYITVAEFCLIHENVAKV